MPSKEYQADDKDLPGNRCQVFFAWEPLPGNRCQAKNAVAWLPEIKVGVQLRAMPGTVYQVDGQDIYKARDVGRVLSVQTVEDVEGLHISWERTGRMSSYLLARWPETFAYVAEPPEIKVGVQLRA